MFVLMLVLMLLLMLVLVLMLLMFQGMLEVYRSAVERLPPILCLC